MKVIDAQGREKISPGFPVGTVTPFFGTVLPDGWLLCDGTSGTPDLRDRFILGDSVIGTGSAVGVSSPVAALTHSGAAVGNHADHVVTQPSAHSNHIVTQPSAHSAHTVTQPNAHGTHVSAGAHTHDTHGAEASTVSVVGAADEAISLIGGPVAHASQGGHTHDAHSAHAGTAVDAHSAHAGTVVDAHSAHTGSAVNAHSAHSVTQNLAHAILKHFLLAYLIKAAP